MLSHRQQRLAAPALRPSARLELLGYSSHDCWQRGERQRTGRSERVRLCRPVCALAVAPARSPPQTGAPGVAMRTRTAAGWVRTARSAAARQGWEASGRAQRRRQPQRAAADAHPWPGRAKICSGGTRSGAPGLRLQTGRTAWPHCKAERRPHRSQAMIPRCLRVGCVEGWRRARASGR